MCGIAGYYCFGSKRPDKDAITKMFIETESRGKDASGYAYIDNGNLYVDKLPLRASMFIKSGGWPSLELPKCLIMHCRQKTQGNASSNLNNHPVYTKSGWAIIHNGFIRNDNYLFKNVPITRDGDVDSEIIVKMLELGGNWEDGITNINRIRGTMAVAAISQDYPDDLLLFRNTNPLVLGYDKDKDILFFGSTEEIVCTGGTSEDVIRGFKFPSNNNNWTTWNLPKNTAYLVSSHGLAREFDVSDTDKNVTYTYEQFEYGYGNNRSYNSNKKEKCCACGKEDLKSYSMSGGNVYCFTCVSRR